MSPADPYMRALAEAVAAQRLAGVKVSTEEELLVLRFLRGDLSQDALWERIYDLAVQPDDRSAESWPSPTLKIPA